MKIESEITLRVNSLELKVIQIAIISTRQEYVAGAVQTPTYKALTKIEELIDNHLNGTEELTNG